MKINVTIDIPREVLEGVFITAIEGGSNYWYYIGDEAIKMIDSVSPSGDSFSERLFSAVYDKGAIIPIHDIEDEEEEIGLLDVNTFSERLQKCIDNGNGWALHDEIDERGDANSSDIVFQYLVLNDVIYG